MVENSRWIPRQGWDCLILVELENGYLTNKAGRTGCYRRATWGGGKLLRGKKLIANGFRFETAAAGGIRALFIILLTPSSHSGFLLRPSKAGSSRGRRRPVYLTLMTTLHDNSSVPRSLVPTCLMTPEEDGGKQGTKDTSRIYETSTHLAALNPKEDSGHLTLTRKTPLLATQVIGWTRLTGSLAATPLPSLHWSLAIRLNDMWKFEPGSFSLFCLFEGV
ncbi:hypothetical protein F5Y08DRAFT_208762 [Xylaria arbuscula]|nr:hypothetical protein F5Y08DRAFT_208762 [Xylaria arbuscula]